ncbi:MAG: amidohydrolase family protein [Pyrinomonadaceae bacterium]|nr:amidohydrolase family protein [Pyrinomonadaceae bacterium]
MKKHFLRFSVAIFAFVFLAISVSAQDGAYAITNAQIVTVSGATIPSGTVVLRDGLIESVGAGASVPADAKVFDGKGLTVYPGLIDADTNLGIPTTPARPQANQQNRQTSNSNYPAVLRPERMVSEKLKAGDAQFASQRNNGFTTVLTRYPDGIFNGQSAVINLAGESVSSMILTPAFAQHVTYRTNRGGVFPTSLMGTFAALRQMFYDAKRLDEIKKMYAKNPRGIKRPEADPSLEALIPIVNGQMPIVFNANTEREIIRTLDLAKEFDLKLIISGGQEAGKLAGRLKARNAAVLLSLNFPKRTLSEHKEADPEPLRVLRLRAEVPKAAARLKRAGVKFAFQSGGIKNIKDYFANAEEATKNGLSKADAIRAMTLDAAEILGVDSQLGSIENGKIANLVVIKGDIFSKDRQVTHVFVDGKLFEQKKPSKKKAAAKSTGGGTAKTAQVGGTWNLTIEPPGQSIAATLVLNQQGSTLSGTITSDFFGTASIKNGEATADGFSFDVTLSVGGQELNVSFSGTVDGNNVEGTATSDQGPAAFTGTKTP